MLDLIANLNRVHTTKLGEERIKRNLNLETDDVVNWCIQQIQDTNSKIFRQGKNWYITVNNYRITVNAHSYTIITIHQIKK
jgi:hypothetical protein